MRRLIFQGFKYPVSLLCLIVAGYLAPPHTVHWAQALDSPPNKGPFQFKAYQVTTNAARHQTVLSGFFSGSTVAELAVIQRADDANRRLQFFSFISDTWQRWIDSPLRANVVFVDVLQIDGLDRLILYDKKGLTWYDPTSNKESPIVALVTHYTSKPGDGIPQIDISRDLNDDQLEDLVVPDIDGFWISIQARDGSFSSPQKIGPPEPFQDKPGLDGSGLNRHQTYGELGLTPFTAPFYLSRIHQVDANQDGRRDLVFWDRDHFDATLQTERGHFGPETKSFATKVAFQADGDYSHSFEFTDASVGRLLLGLGKKITRTMLHSFRDMNGDGTPDIVTLTLSGRSPIKQRSVYKIHFGKYTPDGLHFSSTPNTTIQPRSKSGGGQAWGYADRRFEDLNGDGQVDFVLKDISIGLGGMVRALAGNSIGIDLEFFRMKDGAYPDRPNLRHKIRTKLSPFGRRDPYLPAVLLGDLNGDGIADLLAGHAKGLTIYPGIPGPKVFTKQPVEFSIDMPLNGENVRLIDFNNDGKQDVLIQYRKDKGMIRLKTLITQ